MKTVNDWCSTFESEMTRHYYRFLFLFLCTCFSWFSCIDSVCRFLYHRVDPQNNFSWQFLFVFFVCMGKALSRCSKMQLHITIMDPSDIITMYSRDTNINHAKTTCQCSNGAHASRMITIWKLLRWIRSSSFCGRSNLSSSLW